MPFWIPVLQSVITVAGAAIVAFGVYAAGRKQSRIETTLEMHEEYYSSDFGRARRQAERFVRLHFDVEWSCNDPYDLPDPERLREGYSQMVRFYHRLAVLMARGRLDRGLASDLFSRELGVWFGIVFEAMSVRQNWWTHRMIFDLARRLSRAGGARLLRDGLDEGRRERRAGKRPAAGNDGVLTETSPTDPSKAPVDSAPTPWE